MKRRLLISLVMLLSMVASAYDFEVNNIYYLIQGNEVSVTYKEGDLYTSSCWSDYNGIVTIPEKVTFNNITYDVTSIGDGAFWHCSNLSHVIISNSVKKIGHHAFRECTMLTSFSIPNSVTSIGDYAFYKCNNLYDIILPNTLSDIGIWAFHETKWYNNQPDGIVYIGNVAYYYKGLLPENTSISLNDGTLGIAGSAFSRCSGLVRIHIPNSVLVIGQSAFEDCTGLTIVDLPNSVTKISHYAFARCTNINSITIGNSVSYIGFMAFAYCSNLYKIIIPSSVKHIERDAFYTRNSMDVTICGDINTIDSPIFSNVHSLYLTSGVSILPNLNIAPSSIYCNSSTPPICQNATFSSYYGTLHVPASSLAAYFTAPIWENFDNIVGDAVEPLIVNISQTELDVSLGETELLTATVLPNNAFPNTITWSSSNTNIATVENGTVTALSVGECDIIATCLDKRAICHVVVKDVTISIYLDQNEAEVLPNHIITLTPSASSEVLPELAVSSSDPSIASARVSNGTIRIVGIKEGTTTITVGSADDTAIPATCLVIVYTEPGDLNMDGFVNISDVTSLIDYLLSDDDFQISRKNADINGDNIINISDVSSLIDILITGNN